MKFYALSALSVTAILVIGGMVYRRWKQDQPDPALQRYQIGHRYAVDASGLRLEHDEGLEARTRKRRAESEALRARAAQKDAGKPELDVTRMSDWKRRA